MGRSRAHPINTLEPLAGGPAPSGPTSNGPTPTLAALSRDYQYDPLGQLVAIDHNTQQFAGLNAPQSQTTRYHYDAAHRLVGAQYSDGHLQTWQFDPAGNRLPDTPTHASAHLSPQGSHTDTWLQRTAPTAAAATQHRYWPDNRIYQTTTEVNGQQQTQTITYDAWGNIRRIHTTSGPHQGQTLDLLYDGLHQLRASQLFEPDAVLTGASPMANPLQGNTQGAGKTTTTFYDYDPLGRRISKTVVDQTPEKKRSIKERHWFGWDGDRLVTTETHSATHKKAISTVYEPGSFVPLLRLQTEFSGRTKSTPSKAQVLHYHCNHIGTPEALIDRSGQIVWQAQLDPWGNTRSEYNPHNIQQPIRMQGQQWDEETGLHYNRFRYYDPNSGRYVTQDPIGLEGGFNLSDFAVNNPTNFIDPDGLKPHARTTNGGNARQRRYQRRQRGRQPNQPSSSTDPVNNFEEAAGYFNEEGQFICLRWHCPQNYFTCSKGDKKLASDFIPVATDPQKPPSGCTCDTPAYRLKNEPGMKGFEDYLDAVIKGRKKGIF